MRKRQTHIRRAVAIGLEPGAIAPWRRMVVCAKPEYKQWVEANPFCEVSEFMDVVNRIYDALDRPAVRREIGDLEIRPPPRARSANAAVKSICKWAEKLSYLISAIVKEDKRSVLDGIYADLHILCYEADRWSEK